MTAITVCSTQNDRVHILESGIFGLSLSNIVKFSNQNYTPNIFEANIRSDTVVFEYTPSDGKPKESRFQLLKPAIAESAIAGVFFGGG